MPQPNISFAPCADVTFLIHLLLDRFERRPVETVQPQGMPPARSLRPVKVLVSEAGLPSYFSQLDPEPRATANEQLQTLEGLGLLRLAWLPGETGHLLESAAMPPEGAPTLYRLVARTPTADRRACLESLLLGNNFRFGDNDWRYRAIRFVLHQIKAGKSAAPFNLEDPAFNEDLLIALAALDDLSEETPYRVFSVRVFNDSKRLDDLKTSLVRLARLGNPEWKRLAPGEVLRELNLVANPGCLMLSGAWELVDAEGQILSLGGFAPAVGLSAVQAAHLQRVTVHAGAVLCIENPTTFYEFMRGMENTTPQVDLRLGPPAVLCLWGNPSPACRHLLCLIPGHIPLRVWADLDYGGMNILSQLRRQVDPRAEPYRMDIPTFEASARFARPLTPSDRSNLARLSRRPELKDMRPVIAHLLERGLKLEQEGEE